MHIYMHEYIQMFNAGAYLAHFECAYKQLADPVTPKVDALGGLSISTRSKKQLDVLVLYFWLCFCTGSRPNKGTSKRLPTGSDSEASSHSRLIDCVYHSALGLRVIKRDREVADLANFESAYTQFADPVQGFLAHKKNPPRTLQ